MAKSAGLKAWIAKAEGDFNTALRELSARKHPNYDAACFHAQQCAEKYLKARLILAGKVPPRTHDLVRHMKLLVDVEPLWEPFLETIGFLSKFGVEFHYHDNSAEKDLAKEAAKQVTEFRKVARRSFGLAEER